MNSEYTVLAVHIFATGVSFVLFFAASLISFWYLHSEWKIKTKQISIAYEGVWSLKTLDQIILHMLVVGVIFLTVGLPMGVVTHFLKYGQVQFASIRIFVPFVVWGVYCALQILRMLLGIRGRKAAVCSIYGFGGAIISCWFEFNAILP